MANLRSWGQLRRCMVVPRHRDYWRSHCGKRCKLKGASGAFAPDISGNIAINWETSLNDSLMLSLSHNIAYKDDYFVGGGR